MTDNLNWSNFDSVTEKIETQAERATDTSKRKDANEALGQLLGVTDGKKSVFRDDMNDEQRNMFLSATVEKQDTTQAVLEGLGIRAPANTYRGPAYGLAMTPAMPGGSGGMQAPQQPQQLNQQPSHETPPWLLPTDKK